MCSPEAGLAILSALLLGPPELLGSPGPQADEKSKLPSLVMVIGVVVDRVAVPPERDKIKSDTSNSPEPELVSKTLSSKVILTYTLSAVILAVDDIAGPNFTRFTLLLY